MPIKPAMSIAVQDEAVLQGYVGSLNFAGAGVGAAVVGDVATITIAGGGGGGGSATRVLTTIAFPAKHEQIINIVDATVTTTSKINAWLSGLAASVIGNNDAVDIYRMRTEAKTGSFDLTLEFLTPFAGSLSVDYSVFA